MNKDIKVSELLDQLCFTKTFKQKITSSKDGRLQLFDTDLHNWINEQCKKNCNMEAMDLEGYRECECPVAYINLAIIKLSYIEDVMEKARDKK